MVEKEKTPDESKKTDDTAPVDKSDDSKKTADTSKDGSDDKSEDTVDWKKKHDEQGYTIRLAQKESENAAKKIAALEKKLEEPKEDSDRITELEIKLARTTATAKYGLSEDDVEQLKGTPDEILEQAEHWAGKLKDVKADETDKKDQSSSEDSTGSKNGEDTKSKSRPDPDKKGTQTWMEKYKAASVGERIKMKEQVTSGRVDPTK